VNIAVTGTIGAGKSTVAGELCRLLHAEHCDVDTVCRNLLLKGAKGWHGVVAQWGEKYLDGSGELDRVSLREDIFRDTAIRRKLEDILHPLARSIVQGKMSECADREKTLIVEVPLLYESGWHSDFDIVITVSAENELCLKRIMARDNVSREQAKMALSSQIKREEKESRADFVIDNSESHENTSLQIRSVVKQIKKG